MEVVVFYRQQILLIRSLSKESLSENPKIKVKIKRNLNFLLELLMNSCLNTNQVNFKKI